MHARRVRDVTDNLAGVRIDNNHMRRMRQIKAPAGAIHLRIIPAALAADFNFFHNVVSRRCRKHRERGNGKQGI